MHKLCECTFRSLVSMTIHRSCESGMPANVLEAMLNNMDPSPAVVAEPNNYKRPLSPIMEESEEENTTIKTSILNFDSTR